MKKVHMLPMFPALLKAPPPSESRALGKQVGLVGRLMIQISSLPIIQYLYSEEQGRFLSGVFVFT